MTKSHPTFERVSASQEPVEHLCNFLPVFVVVISESELPHFGHISLLSDLDSSGIKLIITFAKKRCKGYIGIMLSEISKSQKVLVMLGVMSAMLLAALDQTIIATAMPKIVQEFNGLEYLSWVFTAYLLASTVVVPISGKLSDIYGRKSFYIVSIIIFLIGSILSGFSQNMIQLIIFRAIQGIGGGAIMSNSFTIIGDLFPPSERGKWQGMLGGVFGLSSVLGPMLGGWLTDYASWRWTFFINMPVGALALGLIISLMPKFASTIKNKILDYKGSISLTLGLTALLLGLVWGGSQYAWNSIQIIGLFIISVISLFVFGLIEKKAKEPILPLNLFKNPIFSVSMFAVFIIGIGMFGAILYIPLFAQIVLGISAANSGTILTPLMLGLISASVVSGQIISRTGKYKTLTLVGLTIIPIAMFLLSTMDSHTAQFALIIKTIFIGIGLGITMPVFTIVVQNAFDHSKLGVATASTQLFRSIGGTVGVAVMGGILNNSLASKLSGLSDNKSMQTLARFNPNFSFENIDINKLQGILSKEGQMQVQSNLSSLPPLIRVDLMHAFSEFAGKIRDILASSTGEVFFISSILMVLALAAGFFLKEIPLRKSHAPRPVLEEAGIEIAVEEGDFRAKDEPRI